MVQEQKVLRITTNDHMEKSIIGDNIYKSVTSMVRHSFHQKCMSQFLTYSDEEAVIGDDIYKSVTSKIRHSFQQNVRLNF